MNETNNFFSKKTNKKLMKLIINILILFFLANFAMAQKPVPTFEVSANQAIENSTLGGGFIGTQIDTPLIKNDLISITELSEGDFILLEINKNDRKKYSLELINCRGEITIAIADFDAASVKIVKNNLEKGEYKVFLTDSNSNKTDVGVVSF